jgi:hypothetical protein
LRAANQIEFRYTLFPLHPDTPDEGLALEQLFAGREFDIDAMQARLPSSDFQDTSGCTADRRQVS